MKCETRDLLFASQYISREFDSFSPGNPRIFVWVSNPGNNIFKALCFPDGAFQGHAVWHFLSALGRACHVLLSCQVPILWDMESSRTQPFTGNEAFSCSSTMSVI